MNQDAFFTIGKTHRVCEDYCLSGMIDKTPYAMLSDGCSGSKDTDFGSRFLVKSAELNVQAFTIINDEDKTPTELMNRSYSCAKAIFDTVPGLEYTCLDATLLVAYKDKDVIRVICSGDGVIAGVKKDGSMLVRTIEYADNAPVYLNYLFDEERKKQLHAAYNCEKTIKSYDGLQTLINSQTSKENFEVFEFPIDVYKTIGIFSDGVESFSKPVKTATSKNWESVHVVEVVENLLNFKSYAGSFVQRRMQKYLKDFYDAEGQHADDVSAAVIYLGD